MRGDPTVVADTIDISLRAKYKICQSLLWTFACNRIAILTMVFNFSRNPLLNGVNSNDKILFNAKCEKDQMLVASI